MENTYNGWKNRQTWNVSLWINNDERLYDAEVAYVKRRKALGRKVSYKGGQKDRNTMKTVILTDGNKTISVAFIKNKSALQLLNADPRCMADSSLRWRVRRFWSIFKMARNNRSESIKLREASLNV